MGPSISRTEARIFMMIRQEAQYDLGVISSLLPICSMVTYILIDLGFMHSDISFMFAQHINRVVDWLDSQLVVVMPVGGSFIADQVYKNYDIIVEGWVRAAYLIPIDLKEFDAILGMDWLSMHGAKVDFLRKEVIFHTPDS